MTSTRFGRAEREMTSDAFDTRNTERASQHYLVAVPLLKRLDLSSERQSIACFDGRPGTHVPVLQTNLGWGFSFMWGLQ
jgi:hypothetical protein